MLAKAGIARFRHSSWASLLAATNTATQI